jgi:methionine-rich copper-binding protein CopC
MICVRVYCWMHVLIIPPFLSVSPAKLARLKQAKEEAEKEIAEFRAQIELEFQRKVSEVSITIK